MTTIVSKVKQPLKRNYDEGSYIDHVKSLQKNRKKKKASFAKLKLVLGMAVPKALGKILEQFNNAEVDYRIVGGQAAVFYNLRDEAEDWDLAIAPESLNTVKSIMETLGYSEIPDSNGLSWEGAMLIDFILADGELYPTIAELGCHEVRGLKFVDHGMMGYINWKEGDSAYQHLKEYKNKLQKIELPESVEDNFDVEWLKETTATLQKSACRLLDQWIRQNVEDPKDHCFFYSAVMAIVFDGQLMRGAPFKEGETAHFWIEKDGKIVDPTIEQYREIGGYPHYESGQEVDIDKNLDYVIGDSLFKKLDVETQEQIKARVGSQSDTLISQASTEGIIMLPKKIVELANKLDDAGLSLEAKLMDRLVAESQMVAPMAAPIPASSPQTPVANTADPVRQKSIYYGVLTKVTGLGFATIDYYLEILPKVQAIKSVLDESSAYEKGSPKQMQTLRNVINQYNQLDPYNVHHPAEKMGFVLELGKIAEMVKANLKRFDQPEFSDDAVIDRFANTLKESGVLAEFNKLKRALS